MPPKSASSYPPEPWYFREFPFDKPHKEAGLGDGGTAKVEVFLGKAWHVVEFRMDGDGFRELAKLPDRARYLLLDSIATLPVRGGFVSKRLAEKRRARGRNTKAVKQAWLTARWLGPLLLDWAEKAEQPGSQLYKRVARRMRREGYPSITAMTLAAYLVERNWCNAYHCEKPWTAIYRAWPLKTSPSRNPKAFFQTIRRSQPLETGTRTRIWPKPPEQFVADILDGKFPVILGEPKYDVPMTDFRFW